MQKADSNSSAGTNVDSSTKVEDLQSSSHDTKPNVSGLPLSDPEIQSVQPYTATNSLKSYLFNKIVSKILWLFGGNVVTVRNKESARNIEYIVFTAGKLNDSTAPMLA